LLTLIIGSTVLFLLLYKDTYYSYYNIVLPYIVLLVPELYMYLKKQPILKKKLSEELLITILTSLSILSISLHLQSYFSSANLLRFDNPNKMAQIVKEARPDLLYGPNDIVEFMSLLTNIPLMNKQFDSNPKLFQQGYYSTKTMTEDIFKQKTVVFANGVASNGKVSFFDDGLMNTNEIAKKCTVIHAEIVPDISHYYVFVMRCY